jgi:hypothetical protein
MIYNLTYYNTQTYGLAIAVSKATFSFEITGRSGLRRLLCPLATYPAFHHSTPRIFLTCIIIIPAKSRIASFWRIFMWHIRQLCVDHAGQSVLATDTCQRVIHFPFFLRGNTQQVRTLFNVRPSLMTTLNSCRKFIGFISVIVLCNTIYLQAMETALSRSMAKGDSMASHDVV